MLADGASAVTQRQHHNYGNCNIINDRCNPIASLVGVDEPPTHRRRKDMNLLSRRSVLAIAAVVDVAFRPRFTANNRSRPLHKQAALEAQMLACPFGRPLSNDAVRCVRLVGLDARATSLVGLMRRCVRRSPSRLRFSSGIGVAICIPRKAGRVAGLRSLPSRLRTRDTILLRRSQAFRGPTCRPRSRG
jgi:hypothetical protein